MRPSMLLLVPVCVFGTVLAVEQAAERDARAQEPRPVVLKLGRKAPEPGSAVLRGRVVDNLGHAITDAEVTVAQGAEPIRSGADGSFALRVADGGSLDVVVRSRDGRVARARVMPRQEILVLVAEHDALQPPAPTTADQTEAMAVGEGRVRRADGSPASHAVITVVSSRQSVYANDVGIYRVPLPQEPADLVFRTAEGQVALLEGFKPNWSHGGLGAVPDVRLAEGEKITGRVRDGDGELCADATLVVHGAGETRFARTDAQGLFEVDGLLGGDYELDLLPKNGLVGERRSVRLGGGETVADMELSLRAERPLKLRVEDAKQQPLGKALVVAEEAGYRRAAARTDVDGLVTLRGLGDGELSFDVRSGDQSLQVVRYDDQQGVLVVSP